MPTGKPGIRPGPPSRPSPGPPRSATPPPRLSQPPIRRASPSPQAPPSPPPPPQPTPPSQEPGQQYSTLFKRYVIDVLVVIIFLQIIFYYVTNRNYITEAADPESLGFKFLAAMVGLVTVHVVASGSESFVFIITNFIVQNAIKLVHTESQSTPLQLRAE